MTDNFIRADGKSPLSRYVDLLVSVPANLESVLDRNDELKTFLERLQPRRDQSPHDKCFRLAVDEARRDGTAAVICPKLEQAKIAYGRLITAARFVAQDDGGRADFDSAQIELGSLTCDLMNWLKSPASKNTSQCKDEVEISKSSRKSATVNDQMAGTITENHEAMGWNSTQWAEYLKCGKSTVVETATWKKLESARLQAKAERTNDRRRKPKGSDLRRD